MGLIYCATNIENDKKYVGLTTRTLAERKYEHECEARNGNGSSFKAALREFGADSFTWETLEDDVIDTGLAMREKYWIQEMNTHEKYGWGYNDNYGGSVGGLYAKSVVGISVKDFSVRHYSSVLEASKVVGCPDANVRGMCCGCSTANQIKGFVWLYESRYNEILESGGTPEDYVMFRLNFIVQIAEDESIVGYYLRPGDAALAVGGNNTSIAQCCDNKWKKTVYKEFRWMWYRDYVKFGVKEIRDEKLQEVVKISTEGIIVEEFDNVNQAAGSSGLFSMDVWSSCTGKRVSPLPDGYYYRYKDIFEVEGLILREAVSNIKDAVLQFKDNGTMIAEFESAEEAARITGSSHARIGDSCRKERRSLIDGQFWYMYKKDYEEFGYIPPVPISTKSVVKVDLNGILIEKYETRTEAGYKNSTNPCNVSESCSGERKSPFFSNGIHYWFFNESDWYRPIVHPASNKAFSTLGAAAIQTGTPVREVFLKCLANDEFIWLDHSNLSEEVKQLITNSLEEQEEDLENQTEQEGLNDAQTELEDVEDILEDFVEIVTEQQGIQQMGLF